MEDEPNGFSKPNCACRSGSGVADRVALRQRAAPNALIFSTGARTVPARSARHHLGDARNFEHLTAFGGVGSGGSPHCGDVRKTQPLQWHSVRGFQRQEAETRSGSLEA